jgi:hypothetical protein
VAVLRDFYDTTLEWFVLLALVHVDKPLADPVGSGMAEPVIRDEWPYVTSDKSSVAYYRIMIHIVSDVVEEIVLRNPLIGLDCDVEDRLRTQATSPATTRDKSDRVGQPVGKCYQGIARVATSPASDRAKQKQGPSGLFPQSGVVSTEPLERAAIQIS